MHLIYVDESGINYQIRNGSFVDGPFVIYGGMIIDDAKFFHLERIFADLIGEIFDIADWRENEIHASDIWNKSGFYNGLSDEKARSFFEEVLQLIAKLHIKIDISLHMKTIGADKHTQHLEIMKCLYSFLHVVEADLSRFNSTGIIISDVTSINSKEQLPLLSQLLNERTSWRFGIKSKQSIESKFKYESRSCFILDNIHYVDSKTSIFNQVIDVVVYVVKRVLNYCYLRILNPDQAKLDKVPVSIRTFDFLTTECLSIGTYLDQENDVNFGAIQKFATEERDDDEFIIEKFFR